MAERSARPGGWRSRPGVVRVAAELLGLFGLLLPLVEGDQGDLDAAEMVTALVLLVMPAARRPRLTARPASSSAALEQPQGWTRPLAGGWAQFAFMVVVGGLLSVGGLVLALTGRGAERGILVPYSGLRMAMVLGATTCLALASLGMVVFAGAFADDPGESPWPVR